MTESKKAMALAAGLAGVAGVATLAVAPNNVSAATGTVTYADGATTVWQTPAFRAVKRYVVKDQKIAITGQKTVNGTVWYQIGQNEWIPELYLQADGASAPATTANAATAKATTTTAAGFDIAATYTEGAVTIWNNTNYTSASGRYMTTQSNLKAVATVQANGETWYKLANGGFVPARFSAPAGTQAAQTTAATATQAAKTATATSAATSAAATSTPAADTTTTTGKTADDTVTTATTAQATTATTATAPSSAASSAATTATAPATSTASSAAAQQTTATPQTNKTTQTAGQAITVTYTDSVVTEWKSAGYSQAAGKYLSAGTTVTAVGTTTANGETWYQLSDGNYIAARFVGDAGKANSNQAKTTTTSVASTATSTATSTPAKTTVTTPAKTTTSAATTPAKTSTPATTTTTTPATSTSSSRSAQIAAVIKVAKAQLGKPYVWGGKGPNSFDCSGLTHYAFLNGANKEIGGYTGAQEYAGTVVSISNLQVGDLVFWGSRGATYHVAIYLGGNQYINAPKPGQNVQIASISQYFMPSFGVRIL